MVALGACALTEPGERALPSQSWLEFGASLQSYSGPALTAAQARARQEYETMPTPESAIRLAILAAAPNNPTPDFDGAVELLDSVERSAARVDPEDLSFIRFFRPVLERLVEQQTALRTVTSEKAALQDQLDALKDLEEQLNAVDTPR